MTIDYKDLTVDQIRRLELLGDDVVRAIFGLRLRKTSIDISEEQVNQSWLSIINRARDFLDIELSTPVTKEAKIEVILYLLSKQMPYQ